jgi:hypothetical protein
MSEKKPKKETIYIDSVPKREGETLPEIRSKTTHRLLALRCEKGLLLYDRQSREQHLLTWEAMQHPQSK